MERTDPGGTAIGGEHMADCVADLMVARREGQHADGQGYAPGYGETCTDDENAAGQRILVGHRV
jgi:hypothetical protein